MSRQVLVVGGGPAGAAVAGLLAQRGVPVHLVDSERFPREKLCGECVNPGAVALLGQMGVWEEVSSLQPQPLPGWCVTASGRSCHLDYPQGMAAMAVARRDLDHTLLQWAASHGVQVTQKVRVMDLVWSQGRVAGVVARTDAGICRFRAPLVVGADGVRSVVARRLGVQLTSSRSSKVAFAAHWRGIANLEKRGELHLGTQAICGIAPMGKGNANVVVVAPASVASDGGPLAQQVRWLQQWPELKRRFSSAASEGSAQVTGSLHQTVRQIYGPGVLLVGDAAGYFDPLTGQGIYRALRSAYLAVPAVMAALEGNETALRDYQVRLWQELRPALGLQHRLRHVVERPWLLWPALWLLKRWPRSGTRLMARIGDCPG